MVGSCVWVLVREYNIPHISEDILSKLRDFYRPHNKLFEEITGQKFDWSLDLSTVMTIGNFRK